MHWALDPTGLLPVADLWSYRTAADQVLQAAVSRVRSLFPDVEVFSEAVFGSTAPALMSRGRGAQLLVLGSVHAPFPTRFRGLLTSSVCDRVAAHASCPVAIVRPLRSDGYGGSSPRVVVGVGAPEESVDALGYAFRAAAQRGIPVTAVHAWTPDSPADHEAVCGSLAESRAEARTRLEQALMPWARRFADVPVQPCVTAGAPAGALIRASEGAALVVVGSRGRSAARPRLLGSVGRSVSQRARCPVVVVRSITVPTDRRPGLGGSAVVPSTDAVAIERPQRRRMRWQ
jgi:nucleotide-binding universal stress UspA family protein